MPGTLLTVRQPARTFDAAGGALLGVLALFAGLVATHLDVVPIWDAHIYYARIEEAVRRQFDLANSAACLIRPSRTPC